MQRLAIPFKLRAKLELVKPIKGKWNWETETYWLASLIETAPGLRPMWPLTIAGHHTRERAQEMATACWAERDIEAVWRKLPKRKAKTTLMKAVTQQVSNEVQL